MPRYGANHLAVVNVRNQMRELQNSIRDELQRIAETYKSDFEIAKQNEDSVQKTARPGGSQSQVTNEAQVALRELESNAQTYRALYDNFLQRYMESVQQQSFPITEARVITAATRPLYKSNPKGILVLGLATMLGLAFGFAAAAWREFADRVFRTAHQVESHSADRLYCVASGGEGRGCGEQRKATKDARFKVAKSRRIAGGQACKSIAGAPIISAHIRRSSNAPFSAFTEAIRSIKIAIDQSPTVDGRENHRVHVVGSERGQVQHCRCGCKIDGADRRPDIISRLRSQESVAVAPIIAKG